MRRVLLALLVVGCGGTEPGTVEKPPIVIAGGASSTAGADGAGGSVAGSTAGSTSEAGSGGSVPTAGSQATSGQPSGGASSGSAGSAGQTSTGGAGAPTAGVGGSGGASTAGTAGTSAGMAGAAGSTGGPNPVGSPCDCYQGGNRRVFCVAFDSAKGFVCVQCGANDLDCDGDTVEATAGSGCEVHSADFCPI